MNKILVLCTVALAGGLAHSQVPAQSPADWRSTIKQARAAGTAAPRQLSADERALLRRQVQQHSHPHEKS
ncbi:MAG: hypothetical protein HYX47_03310 [Burkholderiales bacterium]|nr:hypothetical protein [Burkholderiales bacterium]